MNVRDIMHKGAVWVKPDITLQKLARRMRKDDIGAIPVGENDRLIGMVTDRDICCRGLAKGRDAEQLTARDVMTKPIVYCRADQTVEEAVSVMRKAKVRRLPVIDENHRLVGMLGLGDVAAKAAQKTANMALKTLAAHHALTAQYPRQAPITARSCSWYLAQAWRSASQYRRRSRKCVENTPHNLPAGDRMGVLWMA